MVHQEDAGLNVELARIAFAKGIWSYVCKMNIALRDYSLRMRPPSPMLVQVATTALLPARPFLKRTMETCAKELLLSPYHIH